MGHRSASFGAAAQRRHSIPVPFFYNFRVENGTVRMDAGWGRAPLTEGDYAVHRDENIQGPLRIVHNGREPTTYPYGDFQHYPDLPQCRRFSLSKERLETWIGAVLNQPINEGNAQLIQRLSDAKEYARSKAIEAGLIRSAEIKTAGPVGRPAALEHI